MKPHSPKPADNPNESFLLVVSILKTGFGSVQSKPRTTPSGVNKMDIQPPKSEPLNNQTPFRKEV